MNKKYEEGYKPNVCIADYTIKFFPTKYARLFKGSESEQKFAKKHLSVIHVFKESILLNDDKQFVNDELKISHLKRLLARKGLKYDKENTYLLRNLKIHSYSKATYTID